MASEQSLEQRVRDRLRALRAERGLTLAEVAAAADLDVSTLSRLESGQRRLALDHVPVLARALGVASDELLAEQPQRDPRVKGPAQSHDGLTRWPLTRNGPASGLHAFKIRVSARRRKPPARLPVHEGQDWIYVLSGRLRLILGEDDLTIAPGEAVEFSTWTPHWFGAVEEPVELIAIFGPQGERLHLHQ